MQDPQIPHFYLSNQGNTPLLWDFDNPARPPGCVKLKSYIKPKTNVSGPASSSVLKKTPKFPNFYFANLETGP